MDIVNKYYMKKQAQVADLLYNSFVDASAGAVLDDMIKESPSAMQELADLLRDFLEDIADVAVHESKMLNPDGYGFVMFGVNDGIMYERDDLEYSRIVQDILQDAFNSNLSVRLMDVGRFHRTSTGQGSMGPIWSLVNIPSVAFRLHIESWDEYPMADDTHRRVVNYGNMAVQILGPNGYTG